jgi:hypothetical protein
MATVVHEHIDVAVPLEGFRISWGGIWAGVLTVMGTLLFLSTLGLAIGVSAVDPGTTEASTVGVAAAVWSGISLFIALFVGGMAATRLGLVFDKAAGAFEGALVWVLSFLLILWLAGSGVRLVASGISGLFSGVAQTVGSTMSGMDDLSSGDVEQIISRLGDPDTARTIASATGIPEQDVRSTLSDIGQRVNAVRDDPARVAEEVRQGSAALLSRARQQLPAMAQQAQEGATKTAWITFGSMLISLVAAVAGAMLGRRRAVDRMKHVADATAETLRP